MINPEELKDDVLDDVTGGKAEMSSEGPDVAFIRSIEKETENVEANVKTRLL